MDLDAADGAGLRKADERPGHARVHRFPHAASRRRVAANVGGTGADVDDVRVRIGDVDRADGAPEEAVADVAPRHARVFGLPHAAAGGSDEEGVRLSSEARNGGAAATAERA